MNPEADFGQIEFWTNQKMARRKRRKDLKQKAKASDKIEVNPGRIYRITDPLQLAYVIFPHKDAKQLRAAFLAIFFTIRNDTHQKTESTGLLSAKFEIPISTICKARSKMSRIGLIKKQDGYWQFSNRFFTALEKLIDVIDGYRIQVPPTQAAAVFSYVEIAKNI